MPPHVSLTRFVGGEQFDGADRARPRVGAVVSPCAPRRHIAGPQGAAPVHSVDRFAEKPHVHLPLGELDHLACISPKAWCARMAMLPPSNYLAMVEIFLCVVLFFACALHVRLRLKHAKLAELSESTDPNTPSSH